MPPKPQDSHTSEFARSIAAALVPLIDASVERIISEVVEKSLEQVLWDGGYDRKGNPLPGRRHPDQQHQHQEPQGSQHRGHQHQQDQHDSLTPTHQRQTSNDLRVRETIRRRRMVEQNQNLYDIEEQRAQGFVFPVWEGGGYGEDQEGERQESGEEEENDRKRRKLMQAVTLGESGGSGGGRTVSVGGSDRDGDGRDGKEGKVGGDGEAEGKDEEDEERVRGGEDNGRCEQEGRYSDEGWEKGDEGDQKEQERNERKPAQSRMTLV